MPNSSTVDIAATPLHPGAAEGPVLRLDEPLSLWGGTDAGGWITDPHHPQHGTSLTGAVVVMSTGRGSSSSSSILAEMIRVGTGPAALVLAEPDSILVLGALVAAELYDRRLPIVVLDRANHASVPAGADATVTCSEHEAAVSIRVPEIRR